MRILAVDDDSIALEILEVSLAAAGYDEIDLAQSAKEAIKRIESAETPYDCMLLDIVMPNTGGIELCKMVRQMPEYFGIPIIMITAVESHETLKEAIQAGATDYVHKPFDGIELGTRLRAAAILAEAVKKSEMNLFGGEGFSEEERGFSDLKLSDAFSLESRTGIVSQSQLWYDLAERDPLPETVHLFAVSIAGAPAIFRTVSNTVFRAFINEAAMSIVHTTNQWQPRVSYIGNGTFIVALLEAQSFSIEKAQAVFSVSLAEMPFNSLTVYKGKIRFCFEHVLHDDIAGRSSAHALCELLQAGADARKTASDYRSVEQQRELRQRFLGRGQPKPVTSWETIWSKPARRVTPKRIAPQPAGRKGRQEDGKGQGGASFDKNIFTKF
ncbi:response regulator [Marivita geojedonensis]|uniref:response regulator n=1 Tax=Marivita geojedonensis TaxID=1123756 RepID=UPI000A1E98BB|nr:response regulator [Marivita geojedonensis]PRY74202.1 response regulator receiver domain-containing protein [Marivita geojedonensis]